MVRLIFVVVGGGGFFSSGLLAFGVNSSGVCNVKTCYHFPGMHEAIECVNSLVTFTSSVLVHRPFSNDG